MSTRTSTMFDRYDFTDDETPLAVCFSDLQLEHLRTSLALAMEEKMTLAYDPECPAKFAMEHEYLRGYTEALRHLIGTHENTQTNLMAQLKQAASDEQAFMKATQQFEKWDN